MLPTQLIALAVLAGGATPTSQPGSVPTTPVQQGKAVQHGQLDWFEGSLEEALAEAGRSNRIVFLDFWADW